MVGGREREGGKGEEEGEEGEQRGGSSRTQFPALQLEPDTALLPEGVPSLPSPLYSTPVCFPSELKPVPSGLISLARDNYISLDLLS